MFGFGNKKKEKVDKIYRVYAVESGDVVDIKNINDDVFASKIYGDGYALKPIYSKVYSPCDGIVTDIKDSFHAYCIKCENGIEILVHIGINSSVLKGMGFIPKVRVGDTVSVGDLIAVFDMQLLSRSHIETDIVVLIKDMDKIENLQIKYGLVSAGETVVMTYRLK